MLYYKHYIDDAFGIWTGPEWILCKFLDVYGTFVDCITHTISDKTADILDITFSKGYDFNRTHRLSIRCHQKVQNKYQYLHWSSWHRYYQKKIILVGELRWYAIWETVIQGFNQIHFLSYKRLRARGYPARFICKCFKEITYDLKTTLLQQQSGRSITVKEPQSSLSSTTLCTPDLRLKGNPKP